MGDSSARPCDAQFLPERSRRATISSTDNGIRGPWTLLHHALCMRDNNGCVFETLVDNICCPHSSVNVPHTPGHNLERVRMSATPSKVSIGGLVVGLLLAAIGIVSIRVFPWFIRREIIKNVILRDGSQLYTMWRNPTIPIYLQFYAFDLTNSYEVLRGDRPSFTQKGPYTYRETVHEIEVKENGNDTVSYRQVKTYQFVRAMSVGPDTESFTTINIPVMVISYFVRYKPRFIQRAATLLLTMFKEKFFYTISIQDIVWG